MDGQRRKDYEMYGRKWTVRKYESLKEKKNEE